MKKSGNFEKLSLEDLEKSGNSRERSPENTESSFITPQN